MKVLSKLLLVYCISQPSWAGMFVKIKGKLVSYNDKELTIADKAGKKQKFNFTEIYLGPDTELSKLLGKEREFFVNREEEQTFMKDRQKVPVKP